MAPRMVKPAKRARLPGLAVLAGCGMTLVHWGRQGPAFSVKGSWEGKPSTLLNTVSGDFSAILAGLEPELVLSPIKYSHKQKGLSLSVEDGKLNADYNAALGDDADTSVDLRVNNELEWKAALEGPSTRLRVRGVADDLDSITWDASQRRAVAGVGTVELDYNSDKEYNLTLARQALAQVGGADIDGEARATNAGMTGRLGVRHELPMGAEVTYSVQNPVGVYKLARALHRGRLSAPVAGGDAAVTAQGDASEQLYAASYKRGVLGGEAEAGVSYASAGDLGYNVSYARPLAEVVPVNAGVIVGVHQGGAYGKLTAQHALGRGFGADYEAKAHVGLREDRDVTLKHALKISNELGYAQLSHGKGEAPRLRMGYEFAG